MTPRFFSSAGFDRFLTRRLPAELQNSETLDEQRAKLLVLACACTSGLGLVFAFIFALNNSALISPLMLVGALLVLLPPIGLKLGYSVAAAGHTFAFLSYLTLCAMIWMAGGPRPEVLVWLFYPPVVAMVFAGYRAGGTWVVLSTLTCFGFYLVDQHVGPFPDLLDEDASAIALGGPIAIILTNSLLFYLHARLQKWLSQSLNSAQAHALEASQEGFQTLLDRLPDALLALRDDQPVYVNPAFVDLLGYSLEELNSLDPTHMLPSKELEERRRHEEALLIGDVSSEVREGTRIRKDGAKVDVETRSFVAPFQGECAVFISFRDVTDRKHLQAKMMQMDRMIAVGTLAAGVAHEINNPLAFMTGNVSLLRGEMEQGTFDTWQPPSDSTLDHHELKDILDDVSEGAERIRAIVSSLRAFAGAQDSDGEAGSVNIQRLLDSCTKMAHNEIKHRARLVTDFDDVPAVLGDNAQLGQVFLNLIVNAAHAVPSGSRDDNEIRVRVTCEDDMICVSVSDTGTGIPQDVQPHIFDPFFTTKAERDGMGLGLYITQNIVRDHGGEICFETNPGEGTTFTVRLPSTEATPADISQPLPTTTGPEHVGRALLIDDERKILRILERALSNFETVTCESAAHAIEQLRDGKTYDVILCDLLMPQMSGMEFFETLEAEFEHLVDRVVFMSGGTFTNGARDFVASCGRPVLAKPFNIDKLQQTLIEQAKLKN